MRNNNQYCTCPYRDYHPVISPITEKIIDLRNQALYLDHLSYQKSLGPDNWTNFPTGKEIFEKFKREYPNVVSTTKPRNDYYYEPHNSDSKYYKSSPFSGTAFGQSSCQGQSSNYSNYGAPAFDTASIVRNCKLQVAKRHVEAADALLNLC